MFRTFRELTLADKFAAAAATVTVSGGVAVLINFMASTDTVQKVYIKYKLLNMKFPKPPHLDRVKLIILAVLNVILNNISVCRYHTSNEMLILIGSLKSCRKD